MFIPRLQMTTLRNKLSPVVLAACTLRHISIEVVRGDALGLGCDGVITGPEGMRKCLPTISPAFVGYERGECEASPETQPGKSTSWWSGVAGKPHFEPAPSAASPLKHMAIVRTTKQRLIGFSAEQVDRCSVVGNVRASLGHLVSVWCSRVVITFFRNENDEASDIVTGIRVFSENNPDVSLELCLCDTNDPVAFVKRLHLLYLRNIDLW